MKKNVIVVGMGEVGTGLSDIEDRHNNVFYIDLNVKSKNIPANIDIMHICIPFKEDFIDDIKRYIWEHSPKLTIINSTVPVGTTSELVRITKEKIVHSPIMGVHPDLQESLLTFEKVIGGELEHVLEAKNHFESIGIKTRTVDTSEESELGKVLSTTYYGWNIVFAKLVKELVDSLNLSYNQVYTLFNDVYNEGYEKMGRLNVRRPLLFPPKGNVGGHCVRENTELIPESKLKELAEELIK